jgi:hypothetical protein
MEENPKPAGTGSVPPPQTPMDNFKAMEFQQRIESEQNFPMALVAGAAAALIGGIVWAVVTIATKYQIGWMAVGVGFLVGYAVQRFGKGVTTTYGVVGAAFALFGCLLGNLLSACGFLSPPFLTLTLRGSRHSGIKDGLMGIKHL